MSEGLKGISGYGKDKAAVFQNSMASPEKVKCGRDFILHGGMGNEEESFGIVVRRGNGSQRTLCVGACHSAGGYG